MEKTFNTTEFGEIIIKNKIILDDSDDGIHNGIQIKSRSGTIDLLGSWDINALSHDIVIDIVKNN